MYDDVIHAVVVFYVYDTDLSLPIIKKLFLFMTHPQYKEKKDVARGAQRQRQE